MRIKLDENMPYDLVPWLGLAHDVDTAGDEGLSGAADAQVWAGAQSTGRFLITQDLDFSDIRQFAPGTHHGVLLLRLNNPSRHELNATVRALAQRDDFVTWSRCFLVVTASKVRVRRPPPPG